MTDFSLTELINLCIAKDQKAQLILYNKYAKGMFNVSFRIVQDIYAAEDIMQEAFITAFQKLNSLKDPKIFGSWLKRIVVNKSINYLNKENRNSFSSLDDVLYKVEDDHEEIQVNSDEIKANQVITMINELKENYRIILMLHFVEGYDYEEIMEITGLSYANCRTTISRAKDQLRKKLEVYV